MSWQRRTFTRGPERGSVITVVGWRKSRVSRALNKQQKAHPGLIGVDIMLLVISDPLGDSFCRQHHALLLFKALLTLLFLQPTTVMTDNKEHNIDPNQPRVSFLLF
jgi:hypothetical protein